MLERLRARRTTTAPAAAAAAVGRGRKEQFERSHETRKEHVTLANKRGMGFNGL